MQLQRFDDIPKFHHQVKDYLLQHEAEHNLLLGILHSLLQDPNRYSGPPYLSVVEVDGQISAVAMRTTPYKLVLSKVQHLEALKLIAYDLLESGERIPGVSGLVTEVETFAQIWQQMTDQICQQAMAMRIHQLTQVETVTTTTGYLRQATEADRPLLLEWVINFITEIGDVVRETPERIVEAGLRQQTIYLWEDGVPVSWASGSRSLTTAARIGPVYTPMQYRRKGYATACVAALSQQLLDQGCDRCFLFTDLANPTSNHIYRQIGYYPVCDWLDYSLLAKEGL